jgi:hypothetical protein
MDNKSFGEHEASARGSAGDERDDDKREEKEKKSKKKDKKKSGLGSARGIETMFRSTYRVHLDLTSLADSKANIMISINGLILSIILAAIAPKIDTNAWLVFPTVTMLVSCVVAIIFAVLAARPRGKPQANLTLDDVLNRDVNLLYFGNSSQLSEGDFITGLTRMVENQDDLYRNMMRDIYGIASVLSRKFALLRTSYTVFMVGVSVSVLAFILVFLLERGTICQ